MHIALLELGIPPHTIGGAEIQGWELARRLAGQHRVTVIIRRFAGEARTETREGVDIVRVPMAPTPFAFVSHLIGFLLALRRLRKDLDAVIAFRAIPNGVVACLAQRLWGIPCCTSIRGLDWYQFVRRQPGRALLRWVSRNSNAFHAQTSRIADDVRRVVHDVAPVVIPNGLDVRREGARGPSLLYVGSLTPRKGVDTLIAAMHHLPEKHLVVVGDGPERTRLETLARDLPVTFRGRVPPDTVADVMIRDGRLFILPSLTFEGMPNVVLQAMSVRLPVITTAIPGGVRDIVCDETTGLLVPPGDPEALAEAIRRLDGDDSLRETVAAGGYAQVEAFAWERVLKEWSTLLENITR